MIEQVRRINSRQDGQFNTIHQRPQILERLMADPDLGPNILLIPSEASWIGGDITLATMASVSIGNSALWFWESTIITCTESEQRMELGLKHVIITVFFGKIMYVRYYEQWHSLFFVCLFVVHHR